jgi:hypothetical protein
MAALKKLNDLVLGGQLIDQIVLKTASYTLGATDYDMLGDATSASFTFTLPPVAGVVGRVYQISKVDGTANIITIDGDSSETIDGVTSKVLSTQWDNLMIHAVNNSFTDWKIL